MLPSALIDDLRAKRVMLFAGSGLSAVLGLPSWSGLIAKMADELDFDRDLFENFGSFPALAEYYLARSGTSRALAKWMADEWHSAAIDVSTSVAHRSVNAVQWPVIYTTNYDHWIERSYELEGKPYCKVVRGSDIANISDGVTQIVKFHGDLGDPDTMVLTELNYFDRLRFETELDIKLRADLLRFSVVFVGYSLNDVNIRNMFYRLSLFRKEYSSAARRLQSYVFVDRRNEVQELLFERWGIETIASDSLDRAKGLELFLRRIAGL